LYNLFHKYGKIESVKVCTNEKGESKGYGFVKFSTLSSAVLAVSVCNGIKIGNKHLKVSFKTQE
jgi:polyadenylate-binding protein